MLNGLIQSGNTTEGKRSTKLTPNNQKMAIGTYISIIISNKNGLNAPTKRHRLDEEIKKKKNKTHIYGVYKKPTSHLKTHVD